jgi:chemotaxis response regulator CheB
VVYGMPREAALVGALDEVTSLNNVAARILARLK